uniref:Uncharacterized protein n=1 Tax=Glossina pallidipes TaxID=7398 RepID=A0A1A9Z1Q5_GLOPL
MAAAQTNHNSRYALADQLCDFGSKASEILLFKDLWDKQKIHHQWSLLMKFPDPSRNISVLLVSVHILQTNLLTLPNNLNTMNMEVT